MKFQKGDQVRVRADLILGQYYNGIEFLDGMIESVGKIDTIIDISGTKKYYLKNSIFCFPEEMLEFVTKNIFNIDDVIVCIDDSERKDRIRVGEKYTVVEFDAREIDGLLPLIKIKNQKGKVIDECFYVSRFKLVLEPNRIQANQDIFGENMNKEFIKEEFAVFNEEASRKYLGKTMEFGDSRAVRKNAWIKAVFDELRPIGLFPFRTKIDLNYHSEYAFMRTCEETFLEPINTGLIAALKKTIQQWQIVYDTGKSKQDVYLFLVGHYNKNNCFLCDYTGYSICSNQFCCTKCIQWGSEKGSCYDEPVTQWRTWQKNKCSANTLMVLEHLKTELIRLEKGNK